MDVTAELVLSEARVMETRPEAERSVRAETHLSNQVNAQITNFSVVWAKVT